MGKRLSALFGAVLILMMTVAVGSGALAADLVPRMEIDELVAKLDSPDIVIYDVRRSSDYDGSESMIKNAERRAYDDVASWADSVPKDKTVVLYCA